MTDNEIKMQTCDEIDSMLTIQLWTSEKSLKKYGTGTIEQKLTQLKKDLEDNSIRTPYYADIIQILGGMKKVNVFTDKVDEVFEAMKKNVEKDTSNTDYENQ